MEGLKKSVNMIRKIDNYEVLQRTKDGYFDANTLLESVYIIENKKHEFYNIKRTFSFKKCAERIEQEIGKKSFYIEKSLNTSNGAIKDKIWVHPTLLMYICFEISVKLKYFLIKNINILDCLKELGSSGTCYKDNIKLYLIHDSFTNELKIGRSFDPKERIKKLSLNSKGKLTLLYSIEEAGYMEFKIHEKFNDYRLHGEWFENKEEIHEVFKKLESIYNTY